MTKQTAVSVEDLTRIFRVRRREARGQKREVVALQDVTLEVGSGELFGALGPNGAGKTTMIKILSTLLSPTSGRAKVAGVDVVDNPWEVRRHIGMVSGGESLGYGLLLCAVVFPLDVLPSWVRWIGQAVPATYWIEAMRRSLLGSGSSRVLDVLSDEALLAITAGSAVGLAVLAFLVYRLAERRVRRLGLIDMQTMY